MNKLNQAHVRCIVAATELSATANVATERAAGLAKAWGVPLHVLTVVGSGVDFDLYQSPTPDSDTCQAATKIKQPMVQAFAEALANQYAIEVHWAIRCGKASTEIAKFIDQQADSLLVVGEHTQHWVKDLFIGGTALKVLQQSGRPVLLSRGKTDAPINTVLVAIDGSEASVNALKLVCNTFANADIHAIHAYPQDDLDRMRLDGRTDDEIANHKSAAREAAEARLSDFKKKVAQHCASNIRWISLPGHPVSVILDHLEDHPCDLLVMARHGRGLIDQVFVGSVLHNLLYHARTNILVVP